MKYKIKNWSEYNKSLINRGKITFWFREEVIEGWINEKRSRKKGRPKVYADEGILCLLILKSVYHLTYRSLEGFAKTLMNILGIELPIPSYTQVSRRARKVKVPKLSQKKVTDIVVDASGLKIFGEGEWLAKVHGKSKRRRWRKIHIAIDPNSQEILMNRLTDGNEAESKELPRLLKGINKPKRIYGDGAYDTKECYQAILDKGAIPIIVPRKRARVHAFPWALCRNHAILEIKGLGNDDLGLSIWKKLKRYHRRSLVETAFSRYKALFGCRLYSKNRQAQIKESKIKCLILNKMTRIGMPIYHVA